MKTLLNCVNQILLRTKWIAGDAAQLTTLTDSARQSAIDIAVQVINEGIDELYSASSMALPSSQGEATITLLTNTWEYTLASDLVQLRWPMIDKTNSDFLYEGDYNSFLINDPEQDDTGQPLFAAIRPTDGKLYLDRAPSSDFVGRVYTYQYDKDTVLSAAADVVPFSDTVFRAMVPAWVQLWKREQRNEFDGELFRANIGRAARLMPNQQPSDSYNPRC